jgi:ribosomal protein S14
MDDEKMAKEFDKMFRKQKRKCKKCGKPMRINDSLYLSTWGAIIHKSCNRGA